MHLGLFPREKFFPRRQCRDLSPNGSDTALEPVIFNLNIFIIF